MKRFKHCLLIAITLVSLVSCEDIEDRDKYKRPDWLAGKLYEQILENETLSIFAQALQLTGYDTIINVSGSYTIFAPTNDAFGLYFQDNPQYQESVENIPYEELSDMVKYH
ncbi:MAG: fasciclin domain-containing protein, partial [Bacteroidales bacterium]|nr:fasciclin domain-containing protein [Bacteroidales bacterium]